MLKKYFFIICCCLTSCTDRIVSSPTILPVASPPAIQALNLSNVSWQVLNKDSLEKFLEEENSKKVNIILYSVDSKNFTLLYTNLLDMQRYIEDQRQVIIFYQQLENNKVNPTIQKSR